MQINSPNACDPYIDLVIDNYRLLEVVGQGGMGCVYKARDEKMGRIVALKLLRNNLGAFTLREGKALGQLNHSNIVNVFYMGESKEGVFIAMEFVDGTTLHEFMGKDVSEIIPAMKQSLLALDHAHGAGVIHRDIKPSNIMVSKYGQVKVMDFGLAKVESPDQDRTVTRLQAGTISYMSPEQVRGLQHVSQLSDIYSLGKTFYHILARRLPFNASESDQYSILKAIIERQFKPPSHYNKNIPRGLDKIIMKAIEKDPSQRFQSAKEMYQALVAYETKAKPKPATDTSTSTTPSFFSRPSLTKKQWTLGTAVLLVFLSITAFASWYSNRDTLSNTPEQTRTTAQVDDRQNRGQAPDKTQTTDNTAENEQGNSTSTSTVSVSIVSTPENSAIKLGDTQLQAPVRNHTIDTGQYTLVIESDGYDSFTSPIEISTDTTITIELLPQGYLVVESSVPGAIVTANGQSLGRTPINQRMSQGSYNVIVSSAGYSTYNSQVRVRSGNTARVQATLQQLGTLRLSSTPGVEIFINNRKQQLTGDRSQLETRLAPGSYQVRITHNEYGTWEKAVSINQGEQNLEVDFTRRVQANIGANVFGASIYIDGVDIQAETPDQIELGVGIRRIEVRKEGYSADPPFIDQLIEGNESTPLQFAFQLQREE